VREELNLIKKPLQQSIQALSELHAHGSLPNNSHLWQEFCLDYPHRNLCSLESPESHVSSQIHFYDQRMEQGITFIKILLASRDLLFWIPNIFI
jgi:hypothetical protein